MTYQATVERETALPALRSDPAASPTRSGRPRVIFIIGWGRSGSTLLGNALGELRDCVHVGEIHDLWSAYADGLECGCGASLTACGFWNRVMTTSPSVADAFSSAREVHRVKRGQLRVRYVARMLRQGPGAEPAAKLDAYARLVGKLLDGVATASHAKCVIDSTKSPAAAALLLRMPVHASFIHLVRDPRATGFSWRRHVAANPLGTRHMTRLGYGRNAASWLYWNMTAELIRRRVDPRDWIRLRYEDFAADPESVLRSIADRFDLSTVEWPVEGDSVRLGTHHTVEGNPSRFNKGMTRIRRDDQWSRQMSRSARAVSVALTAPLFVAYGYARRTPVGEGTN